ncbi:glucokinase [Datura stramonium]|uniref:Glucokinase n=1 Tax=Datura stramonium TaxID=4076 RepID=A0ABS8V262_DATST|nr:glucokinase [Datura stramonium]
MGSSPNLHPPPAFRSFFLASTTISVPNSLTPGSPYFPAPIAPAYPAVGIPPAARGMYKVDHHLRTAPAPQPLPKPPCDFHPSKHRCGYWRCFIKPWLATSPRTQTSGCRQCAREITTSGVPKIPPTCA